MLINQCFVTAENLDEFTLKKGWMTQFYEKNECHGKVGASVMFSGYMRDFNHEETLTSMVLECYDAMAVKALNRIVSEAKERFDITQAYIAHRIGDIFAQDVIVCVLVLAAHRKPAFEASEFIMDYLKIQAPFWKKEISLASQKWVEFKESDAKSAQKW